VLRWHIITWAQCHGGLGAFDAACYGAPKGLGLALRLCALITLIVVATVVIYKPSMAGVQGIVPSSRYGSQGRRTYPPGEGIYF